VIMTLIITLLSTFMRSNLCCATLSLPPLELMNYLPGYSDCSFEIAAVIAGILNLSLSTGKVTDNWLCAMVTPVAKIKNPQQFADFRPICVTPIISRVAERLVVSRWLRPAIPLENLSDRFAFKPTGSTINALIYLTQHVTRLLENNAYVRCLMIDFSKALDVVNHVVLLSKLETLFCF